MPTPLPLRNIFDGTITPTTSNMEAAQGNLRDYLAGLLGTTGAAGDARTALAAAASGANSDITSLSTITSVNGGQLAGMRNRIINGDMRIDQRNAGAAVTPASGAITYDVDRWGGQSSQASKFTLQRNAAFVATPAGSQFYLGATSSSAYAITATDYFTVEQRVEGWNVADFAWGTASAKPVTISFKVWSSLTGTFGGALTNNGGTRSYPFNYSVPVANTWTTVSMTVPGDTIGTWDYSTAIGVRVQFGLGVGSTYSAAAGSWAAGNFLSAAGAISVVGTNAATFYITGVQLELGPVATTFEQRPYGMELSLCQRYLPYITASSGYFICSGQAVSTTMCYGVLAISPLTRVAPTGVIFLGGTASFMNATGAATGTVIISGATTSTVSIQSAGASGLVAGNASLVLGNTGITGIYLTGCEL